TQLSMPDMVQSLDLRPPPDPPSATAPSVVARRAVEVITRDAAAADDEADPHAAAVDAVEDDDDDDTDVTDGSGMDCQPHDNKHPSANSERKSRWRTRTKLLMVVGTNDNFIKNGLVRGRSHQNAGYPD